MHRLSKSTIGGTPTLRKVADRLRQVRGEVWQISECSRKAHELLSKMLELDDLTAKVKSAEATLAKDKQSVSAQKSAIDAEVASLKQSLESLVTERATIAASVPKAALSTFDTIFKARKNLAVVKVVDGLCEGCRVRVRPHLFNQLKAADTIIQCESCQRIFYYVPPAAKPDDAASATPDAPPAS